MLFRSTIEDPVEYQLNGVNQIHVKPQIGLTFANGLRSIVRQDPDVIMVGEVRDAETANIAIHAALTGHLVLTTLHTETAAAAVPRLLDLGVENFLLRSTLRAVFAQRLVRVLCERCKTKHVLTADDVAADPRYGMLGFAAGDTVHQACGCERCGGTGYRGRTGIYELMVVDDNLRRLIHDRAPEQALREYGFNLGIAFQLVDDVLATGGTIAGAQVKGARGYKAAAFSVEALIAAVPQLGELARLDVVRTVVAEHVGSGRLRATVDGAAAVRDADVAPIRPASASLYFDGRPTGRPVGLVILG